MKPISNIEDTEELYQNAPCGYLSIWSDGSIFNVNNTLLKWLGYQREEVLSGRYFQDFLTIGGKLFFESHLIPLLQMRSEVSEINIELKGKDSKKIPTLVNLKKIESPLKNKEVFWISVINIAQRNLFEKELIKAKKVADENSKRLIELTQNLEKFASTSTHGLQAPIHAIADLISLLETNNLIKPGYESQRIISMMKTNSTRLDRMILDLVDYSRILDKEICSEKVPLNDVCNKALDFIDKEFSVNRAHFIIPELPLVLGDPDQLELLLYHIFKNAINYRSEAVPVVKVTFTKKDKFYVISIKDNGIGVEPENLGRIFNFLERLHTYESIPGTGLGLAICKKIVENHGGVIRADSAFGNGSLFYFTLPIEI
ncbi:sensor histidine kinase [Litoribacter populi]|uniref:sensor histidine kinase n=1 Tax=Litoribacter populi TaxID=2598460 RepID=UPI00117CBB45|nr:ATP-binding protein [Litoribacter populi]